MTETLSDTSFPSLSLNGLVFPASFLSLMYLSVLWMLLYSAALTALWRVLRSDQRERERESVYVREQRCAPLNLNETFHSTGRQPVVKLVP